MKLEGYLAPCEAQFRAAVASNVSAPRRRSFPNRDAVVWRDYRWTYKGLADIASRLMAFLASQSVGRGDVVSVMCANRPSSSPSTSPFPRWGLFSMP